MKKQTKANLALTAFLAACLIPSAGMLLLPESTAAANQNLAPAPEVFSADGAFNTEVLQEVSDYVADHFALRQEMITAGAALDAAVFQVSSEEDVTLGREGWLFYTETLEDYLHTAPLSQRQLWSAAHTLALVQEYAASKGAQLYVTVAPNKASLYPQYLPQVGTPLEGEDDIDRLVPLLEQEGVSYIDLFTPFRAQTEPLYYQSDSHWNTRGAALAHDVLVSAMGKSDQELFFPGAYTQGEGHLGDLYEMLYPTGGQLEADAAFQRPFAFAYVRQPRSAEDQRIETERPGQSGNLLMFRDSFGNSLHSFLADAYGQALFSRSMPYQLSLLDETGADTVLIEIVERNLDWLSTRAPIFPAPERLLTGTPPAGAASVKITVQDDGMLPGYLRLEGRLEGELDQDSPIYVQLGGQLYEACPAGTGEGVPFTLYVEQTAPIQEVSVLYVQDGALYSSAAAVI